MLVAAQNETVRDNAFYMIGPSASTYPQFGVQVTRLSGSIGVPATDDEVYNNTCYAPNSRNGQSCVGLSAIPGGSAPSNSIARNNLFYNPGNTGPAVTNTGSANTLSNNTSSVTANPSFTNGTGAFSAITDFKPTANYSGAMNVPVWYDALGVSWQPTWDLGALHH